MSPLSRLMERRRDSDAAIGVACGPSIRSPPLPLRCCLRACLRDGAVAWDFIVHNIFSEQKFGVTISKYAALVDHKLLHFVPKTRQTLMHHFCISGVPRKLHPLVRP